ncbi:hypothetical protein [Rice orange leaf phytoplasma]|uniref:hypothetical protein n=1 Tax=Rice orange leaf phytoplasma TaxID=146897 RepID=UPI0008F5E1ED|nr:hypothetical protein [Rice orange leaf phytoplasma]OIJ44955.1 hypothetical protein BHE82_00075 [Rice orange leaf phytoplasma]
MARQKLDNNPTINLSSDKAKVSKTASYYNLTQQHKDNVNQLLQEDGVLNANNQTNLDYMKVLKSQQTYEVAKQLLKTSYNNFLQQFYNNETPQTLEIQINFEGGFNCDKVQKMAELWETLFKDALGPNKIKFKLNIVSMDDMTPEEEAAFFENLDTASNYLGFAYQDKDDSDTILYQLLPDKNKDKEINFNLKSFRDYLVNQFQNDLAKPEWYDKLINTGGEMEILDLTDSKAFQNFFSLPSNTTIAQTKEQGTINTKTVNFPKIEENGDWKGNANQIIGIVSTCLLQVQNIDAKTKEELLLI